MSQSDDTHQVMMEFKARPLTRRRRLPLLAAMLCLTAVFGYTGFAMDVPPPEAVPSQAAQRPVVTVVEVAAGSYRARLQGHGETVPHYNLDLRSEVGGRLLAVAPLLQSGTLVKRGTVLAEVDPLPYRQALAQAEQALAEARLSLMQEQQQVAQAKAEWQQSGLGLTPDSRLVLREPQLQVAVARVEQAEVAVEVARQQLDRCQIRAPFDALVVTRRVAPGQFLQAGESIATLYGTNSAEVRISLSPAQWPLLVGKSGKSDNRSVQLTSATGQQWQGTITRLGKHVDKSSRQRTVTIRIDNPLAQTPPLATGTFVRADWSGAMIEEVLDVPVSSLSPTGRIWYVDDGQHLANFEADILFQDNGRLFVRPPATELPGAVFKILTHPLPSYLSGQLVIPKSQGSEAGA